MKHMEFFFQNNFTQGKTLQTLQKLYKRNNKTDTAIVSSDLQRSSFLMNKVDKKKHKKNKQKANGHPNKLNNKTMILSGRK